MKVLEGQRFRLFPKSEVHLVRRFLQAHTRYYEFLGIVAVDHPCATRVKVLVYGPYEPDGYSRLVALRLKPDRRRYTTKWRFSYLEPAHCLVHDPSCVRDNAGHWMRPWP
jgi:hypothetical protein